MITTARLSFIALCLAAILSGCASQAKITYAWTADSIDQYRDGEGVLVLAISKKPTTGVSWKTIQLGRRFWMALQA